MVTEFRVSEIFDSVQGEGPSAGSPATFLRLADCNLACRWCDTPYSWDWKAFDKATRRTVLDTEAVLARLARSERLIVTGGEPLLQSAALDELLGALPPSTVVEVETNGTVFPSQVQIHRVSQWNVSPKLANSGEPEARRWKRPVLEALRDTERAWLKLVVEGEHEQAEVEALLTALAWPRPRVLLQAQARTRSELAERALHVARWCMTERLRYSPRLHLELWNGKAGH